ncbi:MAG TPA: hypothetical protein DCW31_08925, partial [Lactobacillus sp.]|nr:hypothetical protein [Lactobacillus sp.]
EPHSEHSEQKNAHRNDAKRSEMTRSDRNEHSRNQSARPNKPNVTKDTHAKRPQVRKNTGSAHQSEATKPVTPVVPVRSEEATTVRANLTDAFVDHETKPLVPQHRQALHVFVRNLRQVRQLRRFGDIDYISKKLHYVVIYMNQDDIEKNQQAISKLSFVRRVMVSERPEVDPFVGHGVNANFVTHTENDGAADALSKLQSEPTDPSKTTTEEN